MSTLVSTGTARGVGSTVIGRVAVPLARSAGARQVLSFAAIGIASTIAYVLAYAALRSALDAPLANGLALVATAVGNTAANRRLTFRVRGSERLAQDHLAGLVAFGIALAITSAAIWLLGLVAHDASRAVEVAALVVANGAATVVRFVVLRRSIGGTGHFVTDGRNRVLAAPGGRGVRGSPTEPSGEA